MSKDFKKMGITIKKSIFDLNNSIEKAVSEGKKTIEMEEVKNKSEADSKDRHIEVEQQARRKIEALLLKVRRVIG